MWLRHLGFLLPLLGPAGGGARQRQPLDAATTNGNEVGVMAQEIFVNSTTPGTVTPIAQAANNGGSVSASATAFSIAAPLPTSAQTGGQQFRAVWDTELVTIPCQSGTNLTGVTRGVENTVQQSHSDGSQLFAVVTGGGLANALAEAEAAAEGALASATIDGGTL